MPGCTGATWRHDAVEPWYRVGEEVTVPLPNRAVQAAGFAVAMLLATPAWASCTDLGAADLARARVDAEAAIEGLEPDRLVAIADTLHADVRCVREPLTTHDIAALYRVLGFAAFVEDRDMARQWFAAARALDPDYQLPPVLLSERHPMRRLYDESTPQDVPRRPTPPPSVGLLRVDGVEATTVPEGRPYLLQHVGPDGGVLLTEVVPSDGATPTYEVRTAPPPPPPSLHFALGAVGFQPDDYELIGFGGVNVGAQLPLTGPLMLLADVGVGWTPLSEQRQAAWGLAPEQVGVPLSWMPYGSLGLGARVGAGPVDLTPGAGVVVAVGHDVAARIGGAASLALSVPAGAAGLFFEGRGGWASGPLVTAAAGVELPL